MIAARIEPPGWLRDGILVQLSAGPRLDFTGPSGRLAPGSAFPSKAYIAWVGEKEKGRE
jgi:hypothetical protein